MATPFLYLALFAAEQCFTPKLKKIKALLSNAFILGTIWEL
jgi:hypothetical protein